MPESIWCEIIKELENIIRELVVETNDLPDKKQKEYIGKWEKIQKEYCFAMNQVYKIR